MAAVLCLMFLPLIFGALFMVGSIGSVSIGTILAAATFVLLSAGLVYGAMRLANHWEHE